MPETQDWAAPQSTPVSRVFGTTCNVTEAGATTIIVGATGSLYLVLVYLAAYSLPIGNPKSIMRGSVQINALLTPTLVLVGALSISDTLPFVPLLIPYPVVAGAQGDGLEVTCRSDTGAGRFTIGVDVAYYQVTG